MNLPLLFESGILSRDGRVTTIAVHALVVQPASVHWTNPPRDAVSQTVEGALLTKGGRGLASCSIQGTFGLEVRALGTVAGSGPARQRRFENEIVRLGSATTRAEIDDVIRNAAITLTGEVNDAGQLEIGNALAKALATFDPKKDVTFINVYDFNSRHFNLVGNLSFDSTISARGGGVAGMSQYNMSFAAVAPPIVGTDRTSKVLQALMNILPVWQDINEFIGSATLSTLFSNLGETLSIPASLLEGSLSAIAAQAQSLTALMSGGISSLDGMSTLFGLVDQAIADIETTVYNLSAPGRYEPTPSRGEIDWSTSVTDASVDAYASASTLQQAQQSLRFQKVAGRFYGMSEAEYRSFLEAGGRLGGSAPNIRSTRSHTVSSLDTIDSISRLYNVTWREIGRLNQLTPEEALVPGTILLIPVTRAWGPQAIDGLPVYDSHAGESALGRDIAIPVAVTTDGDLYTVSGAQCLLQALRFVREVEIAPRLMQGMEELPSALVAPLLEQRAQRMLEADPRVDSASVRIAIEGQSLRLEGRIRAINGYSISPFEQTAPPQGTPSPAPALVVEPCVACEAPVPVASLPLSTTLVTIATEGTVGYHATAPTLSTL